MIAGVGGLGLWLALRGESAGAAQEAIADGDFAAALERTAGDEREAALLAAATAAKHLLLWERAEESLGRVLAGDPGHGEALLELGLLRLYRGRSADADELLVRALGARADLAESITLHRAVAAELAGHGDRARALFEEVEAQLETKLRLDVGEGDPEFAEWFLHSAVMWRATGRGDKAEWAWKAAVAAAPHSRLADHISGELGLWPA
ncbi:MAG: hypothetical protein R3190_03795 [Thermoanaerobaculia bacterium]|nr:hypothetical protein [Thermoanaerobaculia bacterium]